jgi:hypothetical protein
MQWHPNIWTENNNFYTRKSCEQPEDVFEQIVTLFRIRNEAIQLIQELVERHWSNHVICVNILLKVWNIDHKVQIFFSDEATFHINGKVNKCNCVLWGTENPYEIRDLPKVELWCGVSELWIVGLNFSENVATKEFKI